MFHCEKQNVKYFVEHEGRVHAGKIKLQTFEWSFEVVIVSVNVNS